MIKLCRMSFDMFFLLTICASQLLYGASESAMALERKQASLRATSIESLQSRCGRVIASALMKNPKGRIAQSFTHNVPLGTTKLPMTYYIDEILKKNIGWRRYTISSEETTPAEQHAVTAMKLACSFDGKLLFSGSISGMLRRWDIDSFSMQTFAKQARSITALACSAGGDKVFARASRAGVHEWTFSMGRKDVRWFRTDTNTPIACSADGADLFAVFGDCVRSHRGWPNGRLVGLLEGQYISAISCSAKGDRIFVGVSNGELHLWDVKAKVPSKVLSNSFPFTGQPVCNADGDKYYWIFDRQFLITWSQSESSLSAWSVKTTIDSSVLSAITCQADGERVFLGTETGEIYVRVGKRAYFIGALGSEILSLACSGDGSRLFAGSIGLLTMWSDYIQDLLQLDSGTLINLFYAMKTVQEKQKPYTIDLNDKKWADLFARYTYLQDGRLFAQASNTEASSSSLQENSSSDDCVIS